MARIGFHTFDNENASNTLKFLRSKYRKKKQDGMLLDPRDVGRKKTNRSILIVDSS